MEMEEEEPISNSVQAEVSCFLFFLGGEHPTWARYYMAHGDDIQTITQDLRDRPRMLLLIMADPQFVKTKW